jgi:hypothetical protein
MIPTKSKILSFTIMPNINKPMISLQINKNLLDKQQIVKDINEKRLIEIK